MTRQGGARCEVAVTLVVSPPGGGSHGGTTRPLAPHPRGEAPHRERHDATEAGGPAAERNHEVIFKISSNLIDSRGLYSFPINESRFLELGRDSHNPEGSFLKTQIKEK